MIDHVPLDVNVGSIAIQRFIKNRQPLLTLHGHIHEASRLSGSWRDRIGRTRMFTAAYDGPHLALVRWSGSILETRTGQLANFFSVSSHSDRLKIIKRSSMFPFLTPGIEYQYGVQAISSPFD